MILYPIIVGREKQHARVTLVTSCQGDTLGLSVGMNALDLYSLVQRVGPSL